MASYNELMALINAYINRNGVQAITGQVLNGVLRAMVEQLGRGYTIMGAATRATDPGTPDAPECWFASEPGTYAYFDGIVVSYGEIALLSYNTASMSWEKDVLAEGLTGATATVDDQVGTPSVQTTYNNGVISFAFHNLKGVQGDEGPIGPAGVDSVVVTVDNTSGSPACSVSLNAGVLTLAFTGLKGAQGDTGSSVDYPFTIVNNLTTNDATQALSAAMGVELAGQVSQLEHKVKENPDTLTFDFSSGSITKYSYRSVSYPLTNGHIYRVVVKTNDNTLTYFSTWANGVRQQNTLMKANGARDLSFICSADADELRMSLAEDGNAVTYSVYVYDQTNGGLLTIIETIDDITRGNEELVYVCPADGSRLRFGQTLKKGTTIKSVTGGVTYLRLYTSDADTTGEDINVSRFPYITTKDYSAFLVYKSGSPSTTVTIENAGRLSELTDLVTDTNDSIVQESLVLQSDFIGGKGFNSTGVFTSSADLAFATEKYYFFKKGAVIGFKASLYSGYPILCIYDRDKNFLSKIDGTGAATIVTYTYTFTESGYARFGCYKGNFSDFSVVSDALAADVAKNAPEIEVSWVKEQRVRIESLIKGHINSDIVVFAFNSDQHFDSAVKAMNAPAIRGLNAIKKMADNFPFDFIVLGGDEAGYNGNTDNTIPGVIEDILDVFAPVDMDNCPVVAMAGNHDAYQNVGAANCDGSLEYNTKTKRLVSRRFVSASGKESTNCYFDDEAKHVRYVFLDSYSVKNGATLGSYGADGDTELVHIIEDAFGDSKLVNSDWEVVLFSHQVIPDGIVGNNLGPMGSSFWTKIKTYLDGGVSLKFAVNGHAHCISQGVKDGYAFIGCSQALPVTVSGSGINQSFDGITYVNTINSGKETAFDVFVWNRSRNKLYAYHYGAGVDRVFDLTNGAILLDDLSGVVSSDGTVTGGTISATNNNAKYVVTLDGTGEYSFPYLCPEHDWLIEVSLPGGESASEIYSAESGTHTLNIVATL